MIIATDACAAHSVVKVPTVRFEKWCLQEKDGLADDCCRVSVALQVFRAICWSVWRCFLFVAVCWRWHGCQTTLCGAEYASRNWIPPTAPRVFVRSVHRKLFANEQHCRACVQCQSCRTAVDKPSSHPMSRCFERIVGCGRRTRCITAGGAEMPSQPALRCIAAI